MITIADTMKEIEFQEAQEMPSRVHSVLRYQSRSHAADGQSPSCWKLKGSAPSAASPRRTTSRSRSSLLPLTSPPQRPFSVVASQTLKEFPLAIPAYGRNVRTAVKYLYSDRVTDTSSAPPNSTAPLNLSRATHRHPASSHCAQESLTVGGATDYDGRVFISCFCTWPERLQTLSDNRGSGDQIQRAGDECCD
jgi:hypothetical protein